MAIARAIVNRPSVLLLDEPLGALDLQLRRQMQLELKRLQKQVELTFIYITHDQEEALNMSDRIAVMHDGRFEQVGTPAEVYDRPRTSFVARFVGTANIVEGRVAENRNGTLMVHAAGGEVPALCCGCGKKAGDSVTLAVRSEHVATQANRHLADAGAPLNLYHFICCRAAHLYGGAQLSAARRSVGRGELLHAG